MAVPVCPSCRHTMQPRRASWCFRCPACGTWGSTLEIGINSPVHAVLDEAQRETGLAELRHHNLGIVADRLGEHGLAQHARVLDVGSAHGWFLSAAGRHGWTVEGIEPDEAVAARSEGGPVRVGFFPDALAAEERFDAITFNDVLEHLPDVDGAVESSVRHLKSGGLLSVNIPNSRGLFFRLATLCHALGLRAAFERLWQVGLPSPHLWYFDPAGLTRLCERHGLVLESAGTLDSVRRAGLWQRAHADRRPSLMTVVGVAGVWLLAPLLNARRCSDIMHLVFRKPAAPESGA